MSVLVTGGAGYVGSAIMERLVANGETVACLDNFSTGHHEAICDGVDLIDGSIMDEQLVAATLSQYKVETVVHCAALSIVQHSNRVPLEYFENNVVGAHVVLKAMVGCDVRRFVLSSTAAVYGNPTAIPISESHAIAPINAYGRSKRMIEQMLEWHTRAYDLSFVSLRYFNAAGATSRFGEDHSPETHLIPLVLEAAMRNQPGLLVYGNDYSTPDGSCHRDYIHVVDLADAHVRAIEYLRNGGNSDTFNLGVGEGHSVFEVIRAAERATGRSISYEIVPRREGDATTLVASNEKAKSMLNWVPVKSTLDEIVEDAWRWKQLFPTGYKK